MTDQLDLEVFRAGDYGDKGVWDEAKLDQIAADYDPQTHEAPVTIDHAQRGPALGWVATVRRVGDRLVARLRGVSEKLMEMIRAGAFKKRSVELYPRLRATGRPYLRAVSFLGAAVPEVKGLADPLVPAGAPGASAAPLFAEDAADPSATGDATDNPPPLRIAMAESARSDLSDRSDRSDSSGASDSSESSVPSDAMDESRGSPMTAPPASTFVPRPSSFVLSFSDLARRLRGTGRWRPAWAERGLAEFYRALAAVDQVAINEDESLHAAEWFAEFLESLPPVVAMEEASPPPSVPSALSMSSMPSTLSAAPNVDPASLDLHRAALAFQQSHPGVAYAEALSRCASSRR
jgi:hypothetical protein